MFWRLLSPFVGEDLGKATAELEQKLTDKVIERCAQLAHRNEIAACERVMHHAGELARSGFFGPSVPDLIRIQELERQLEFKNAVIETQALAFERMSWLAQQTGE